MVFLNTLFGRNNHKQLYRSVCRFYATVLQQDFTVTPFCNIKVNLPIHVLLAPLDVHEYRECDKVIVKVNSNDKSFTPVLQCTHNQENIVISGSFKEGIEGVVCKIEAPVKANLNITTERNGCIGLSNFNGDNILLKSVDGDIKTSKCHCNKISITSSGGNIACSTVMQAADIHLKTQKYGTITTGRLQGLNLSVETENGDIETESSYCNNSSFVTNTGNLNLRNAHKDCKVVIRNKGNLHMTGFDGILNAILNEGNADIQLSRILGKSEIKVGGNGLLNIKLSEKCLDEICFKIMAKNVHINEDTGTKIDRSKFSVGKYIILNKKDEVDVVIDSKESIVTLQASTWMDMFNLKLPSA